jgi:hypothetical protein
MLQTELGICCMCRTSSLELSRMTLFRIRAPILRSGRLKPPVTVNTFLLSITKGLLPDGRRRDKPITVYVLIGSAMASRILTDSSSGHLVVGGQEPCNLHPRARHEANHDQTQLSSMSRHVDYSTNQRLRFDRYESLPGTCRTVISLTNEVLGC